jgi:hypothetical protein
MLEDVPSLAGFPENGGLALYEISTPFVVNVIGMITRELPAQNIAAISVWMNRLYRPHRENAPVGTLSANFVPAFP